LKKLLKITLAFVITVILVTGIIMPEIIMGRPASTAVGNWYQQFMPNLNNMPISDITFIDSSNGYAITGDQTPNDTNYILKTTTGGDSWNIVYRAYRNHLRVKFLNVNTGFVCGGFNTVSGELIKTTNAGINWLPINTSGAIWYDDMALFGEDTIWLVQRSTLDGGVFRTTNGGINWTTQFYISGQNPEKIYMYNSRIGYISKDMGSSGYVRKTTDGGATWSLIVTNDYYLNIYFTDSLMGWKCSVFGMKKTTDGGLNWVTQILPSGGIIQTNVISSFSNINKDTIWANGGYVLYPNNQVRCILNRTTNGGNTWLYQIPDTSIFIGNYNFIKFTDKLHGWAYNITTGIHTVLGGDTSFVVGVKQTSTQIPSGFKLYQNYPNPFNPTTNIGFRISGFGLVTLKIFDITGREISELINKDMRAGEYLVDWNATGYSSGIYFYKITVVNRKEVFSETKKMILVK